MINSYRVYIYLSNGLNAINNKYIKYLFTLIITNKTCD